MGSLSSELTVGGPRDYGRGLRQTGPPKQAPSRSPEKFELGWLRQRRARRHVQLYDDASRKLDLIRFGLTSGPQPTANSLRVAGSWPSLTDLTRR